MDRAGAGAGKNESEKEYCAGGHALEIINTLAPC